MLIKLINAFLTVLYGVGAALLVYYALNKIAELLPPKWEERLKPYLYILPAYLAITIYLLYPAIQSIINSFQDRASEEWVGFANYSDLLGSPAFRDTMINTVLWMIVVPTLTVILGLAVATLADRLGPTTEKLTKTIIFLPMAIALAGSAVIWDTLYNAKPAGQDQIGVQNAIITALGFDPVVWLQESTLHLNSFLLMLVLLWAQVGFAMVLLSAAVKGVPVDTLEAARIDGATERQVFFSVIVPQVKGTIITVFITVLIAVLKIFDVVYVMTNGNFNTNVLGNEFYNQLTTNFNYGSAAAIVVIMMIVVIPVMFYQVRHFKAEEANA
ncbi:sugar ABC transporter permease [Nocardioides aestuarii]|uniref:Carbohydrate ABC transporter permease n=1 Tax=Nocardioides aestuarii TaxID=252231 RepID=A0ABW4TKF5_9ACTN